MTEAEWLGSSEPRKMLRFMRLQLGNARWLDWRERDGYRLVPRRWRLLACGICRKMPRLNHQLLAKVEHAEQLADQSPENVNWEREMGIWRSMSQSRRYRALAYLIDGFDAARVLGYVRRYAALRGSVVDGIRNPELLVQINENEKRHQYDFIRCVFGNPFRPTPFDPAWLTPTVVALANGIYTERAFDRMPMLADALEEAGCDNVDVLLHCRGDGPHVRGCWVVDAVLGKE